VWHSPLFRPPWIPFRLGGAITLPAGDIEEPFVDINDIADVAVAALTEEGHAYETYEVTGPRLMTFTQAAEAISAVTSHDVQFIPIPLADFNQAIESSGAPAELVWLLNYLFETILDGRNAYLETGFSAHWVENRQISMTSPAAFLPEPTGAATIRKNPRRKPLPHHLCMVARIIVLAVDA
jgi:hypothetical protein